MACDPITLQSVDAQEWERLKQAVLAKVGVVVEDNGSYTGQGFSVDWIYNEYSQQLTIEVIDHPPMIDCNLINSLIQHGIQTL